MNPKIESGRDIGVAVNADAGANIHIHVGANTHAQKQTPQKTAVHTLLKSCEATHSRHLLQKISKKLFNSSKFMELSLENLEKLQIISLEFNRFLEERGQQEQAEPPKTTDQTDPPETNNRGLPNQPQPTKLIHALYLLLTCTTLLCATFAILLFTRHP